MQRVVSTAVSVLASTLASVLLTGCGGGGGGESAPATPVTSIADALQSGVARGLDGIWVYVDDGSSQPAVSAAGVQNKSTGAMASADALFKIASISKLFIAVSSIKLVHDGSLRLDDTLVFWLPALAPGIENADRVTVQHLLQHRSGVPDFDSQPGFSWERAHTDNDALLELVLDKPADFAPGSRGEYSNTNYLLLGKILDQALGYSHHDYVQNTILSPLGMTDTYSLLAQINSARLARGYWDGTDRAEQDYVAPGGSMVSTARDTGIFIRALATGTLLTDSERTTYTSLFDSVGHSGWLPGYQSIARYHRDTDTVLVQLVNTTGGTSENVSSSVYDSLVALLVR